MVAHNSSSKTGATIVRCIVLLLIEIISRHLYYYGCVVLSRRRWMCYEYFHIHNMCQSIEIRWKKAEPEHIFGGILIAQNLTPTTERM